MLKEMLQVRERIKELVEKENAECESMIAKYIAKTGISIEDLCLVRQHTESGYILFVDLKSNYKNWITAPDENH